MTYTARGTVSGDRRLVIDLPAEMATGDVEVTVTPVAAEVLATGNGGALLALFDQWRREGWTGTDRTKEEIDAELRAMRDEWDDD